MTAEPHADRAVVVGAGIGGLAAAAALASHFSRVTVLERDRLPPRPEPRAGVPQCRHVHGLLGGGLAAFEALFPGIAGRLAAAGAIPIRVGVDARLEQPGFDPFPQRDLGWTNYSMSRPLLEHVVRGFVARRRPDRDSLALPRPRDRCVSRWSPCKRGSMRHRWPRQRDAIGRSHRRCFWSWRPDARFSRSRRLPCTRANPPCP